MVEEGNMSSYNFKYREIFRPVDKNRTVVFIETLGSPNGDFVKVSNLKDSK